MAKQEQPEQDWKRLTLAQFKEAYSNLVRNRRYIVRQEKLYPPEHPLRLTFQRQRAMVDVRIHELKEAAKVKGMKLGRKKLASQIATTQMYRATFPWFSLGIGEQMA